MNITNFKWSLEKCIHCGKCLKVCPGDLFIFDDKNELKIKEMKKHRAFYSDMLPSYRTMKYKSPIWGYFHVQKE